VRLCLEIEIWANKEDGQIRSHIEAARERNQRPKLESRHLSPDEIEEALKKGPIRAGPLLK
jgi:hypothetical protein